MTVVKSKTVRRRVETLRPNQIIRTMGIKEFYEKRNKILIVRGCGGLGDILMHRMIFKDFKRLLPQAEIHFACPTVYHDAIKDHPYIDKIISLEELSRLDYSVSYNTTTACGRTEMSLSPLSGPHRSDIWANHCGVILTDHEMHFHLTEEELTEGKRLIESKRDREGPSVLIAPISAMHNKNLNDKQIMDLIQGVRDRKCFALGLHNNPIAPMFKEDIPCLYHINLRQWLAVINQVDYVVSVDSAALHAAGGMGKPVLGIFTFVNGSVYCKYYPKSVVLQGGCPYDREGCYNWTVCPETKNPKPCLTSITSEMILSGVDNMMSKWPKKESI